MANKAKNSESREWNDVTGKLEHTIQAKNFPLLIFGESIINMEGSQVNNTFCEDRMYDVSANIGLENLFEIAFEFVPNEKFGQR